MWSTFFVPQNLLLRREATMGMWKEIDPPELWENLTLDDIWLDGIQFIELVAGGNVLRFLPFRLRRDTRGHAIRLPLRPMICSRETAQACYRQTSSALEQPMQMQTIPNIASRFNH